MGPVSFTKLPFVGTAAQTGELATALTEAKIGVVSIEVGSGVLVRSDDIGRAKSILSEFEQSGPSIGKAEQGEGRNSCR